MKLNQKSQWDEDQIVAFLGSATVPIRLSFLNDKHEPLICSLWYRYEKGVIWCASHKNSFLVKQLKNNSKISFEVSTNDYPYKGVRGQANIALVKADADKVLGQLITKYLAGSNTSLSTWLMSRSDDEYVIKITPSSINAWDFSNRMQKSE